MSSHINLQSTRGGNGEEGREGITEGNSDDEGFFLENVDYRIGNTGQIGRIKNNCEELIWFGFLLS